MESLPNTHISRNFEYPKELQKEFGRARKIEWITVIYLITAILMMTAVMSNSQAMKTAWIEEPWVKRAEVRSRQEGHVYFGELFIVPSRQDNITEKIDELKKRILSMNWRVFDVVITLVKNPEQ